MKLFNDYAYALWNEGNGIRVLFYERERGGVNGKVLKNIEKAKYTV